MSYTDPVLQQATQMDSRLSSLGRDPFGVMPLFTFEFVSEALPALSGPVVVRFPLMGDMLNIESLSQRGKPYSEVLATLQVLIEKAPASWYHLAPGERQPSIGMSRLPFDPAFFTLFRAYVDWRDSFRGSDQPIAGGSTE